MIENTLWTELFRPKTLDGYIGNEFLINKVKQYIETQDVPHLLFYNTHPGVGKTTLVKIIANALDADVLYINASDENSVDVVRDKIKSFASTMGFSKWKIIICDEFDFFTINGQAALRNIMESFSNTTRFLITCNFVEKLLPAIRSRCQEFEIHPPDKKSVAIRLKKILDDSNIKYELKDLVHIIDTAYPDIRKVINIAQHCTINNQLTINKDEKIRLSYMDDVLTELKSAGCEVINLGFCCSGNCHALARKLQHRFRRRTSTCNDADPE